MVTGPLGRIANAQVVCTLNCNCRRGHLTVRPVLVSTWPIFQPRTGGRRLAGYRDRHNLPQGAAVGGGARRDRDPGEPKMTRLRREQSHMLGNGYCTDTFESICETCTYFQPTIEFHPTLQRQHDDAKTKNQTGRQQLFQHLLNRLDRTKA